MANTFKGTEKKEERLKEKHGRGSVVQLNYEGIYDDSTFFLASVSHNMVVNSSQLSKQKSLSSYLWSILGKSSEEAAKTMRSQRDR